MAKNPKLKELILYLARRMEEEQHVGRGRIKLAKLLWRSDFGAYWTLGEPITEATYQADQFGTSPVDEMLAIRDLQAEGRLTFHNEWDRQQIPVSIGKAPDLSLFSGEQIAFVDDQLERYRFVSARVMVDEAHEFPAWLEIWKNGEGKHKTVPLESVFWDVKGELEDWEHEAVHLLAGELGMLPT